MGKYFGTDGIRGVANDELTADLAYRAGFAAATVMEASGRRPAFFIGRDTRISGDFLEAALSAGLCAAGADVYSLGVLSTPAVAFLTATHTADAGIVISASHNPFEHNGIKIFGSTGFKLSDWQEAEIEALIDQPPASGRRIGAELGRITRAELSAEQEYADHIINSAPCRLDGMKVAIDCANGAASQTAERIFAGLGAQCQLIFCEPNGVNINDGCGSTHIGALSELVKLGDFDAGVAFDGDADRCLMVDETGALLDGDRVLGLLAQKMQADGRLKGGVAVTVMSNLGLHGFLRGLGIPSHVTKVGDRYVLEKMRASGCNMGGEQSGHVILSDFATTGDGQLTAVHVLCMLKQAGRPLSQLAAQVPCYPQVTINVPVPNSKKAMVAELPQVREVAEEITRLFGEDGRILIRPSGTEPLVRVMVEGKDEDAVRAMVRKAADLIEETAK